VTRTAVAMVELFPSLLPNLVSGPQIAVMKTATYRAAIASDAHISGMSGSDHRDRSCATREGSCDIVHRLHVLSKAQSSRGGVWETSAYVRIPTQ
jgi:hypothetical protein